MMPGSRIAAVLGIWIVALCAPAYAQEAEAPAPAPGTPASAPADPASADPVHIDKRIMGVLPNYRTADGSLPYKPITSKQKLIIGLKDSFDKPIYLLAGFYAAIGQLQNANPSLGQGMEGYAKRYVRSLGDAVTGNMMTEGIMPVLLKEDPRYFLQGPQRMSTSRRLGYALSRVLVTKTDSGGSRFNFSEWLGNGAAVGLSNLWYPEGRNLDDNLEKLAVQVGSDALSNVLKEFWPDVKKKMHRH